MDKGDIMKSYIVTDIQLRELVDRFRPLDSYNPDAPRYSYKPLRHFLQSKKPITEIASGEFDITDNNYGSGFIGEDNFIATFKEYIGKNIKIYVEEI